MHLTFMDTMAQLQPLVDGLRQEVLKHVFIHADETHPVIDKLHGWLTEHRAKVPEGSATAKAMD